MFWEIRSVIQNLKIVPIKLTHHQISDRKGKRWKIRKNLSIAGDLTTKFQTFLKPSFSFSSFDWGISSLQHFSFCTGKWHDDWLVFLYIRPELKKALNILKTMLTLYHNMLILILSYKLIQVHNPILILTQQIC